MESIIAAEMIERKIYLIRGQKVMLDRDLAELYVVETFNLNKAVKRNIDRFPPDFMFQITKDEAECLIFQSGMSKTGGRGGRRYLPYAFTEQGIAVTLPFQTRFSGGCSTPASLSMLATSLAFNA